MNGGRVTEGAKKRSGTGMDERMEKAEETEEAERQDSGGNRRSGEKGKTEAEDD